MCQIIIHFRFYLFTWQEVELEIERMLLVILIEQLFIGHHVYSLYYVYSWIIKILSLIIIIIML